MICLRITPGADSKQRACTIIEQHGDTALRVSVFLDQPFQVCGNTTYAYEPMAQVLTDLLLGIQLYNFQHSDAELLDVTAEYTKSEDKSASFELVQSLITHAEKSGHHIAFSEVRGEEKNTKSFDNEGVCFSVSGGYEVKCLSFSEFADKKTGKANGGAHLQMDHSRRRAMDFAHPVDAKIIRVLDSPVVNQAFSKLVNLSTDMNYGLMMSTGIRLDDQPSEAAEALHKCASVLGIPVPYTVVSSSVPGLNAVTVGTDGANCIAVSSLMKALMSQDELTFVLGHECGHITLGHVLYHTVLSTVRSAAELIPLVGHSVYQLIAWPLMAWYRRSEISADRAGLLCCGDINVACKTLLKLECGFMDADGLDVEDYISNTNRQLKQSFLGRYQELLHEHPILAKRMEALRLFAQSEKYYRLSSKPIPEGAALISDSELDSRTEKIVQVMN